MKVQNVAGNQLFADACKVSVGEKLAYGVGDLSGNIMWSAVNSYVLFFLASVHRDVNLAIIGTLILVSRIFDGVSDLLMGFLIDRTRTRWGKARPWVLWMAVPYSVVSILLFAVPQSFPVIGKYIYFFIFYNLVTTVTATAVTVPYATLSSLITRDQRQRELLNIFRQFMNMFAALIVLFTCENMVRKFGDGTLNSQKGWVMTFVVYGVVCAVLYMITFLGTKERVNAEEYQKEKKKSDVPVKKQLRALFQNKYWILVAVTGALTFVIMGLFAAAPFYTNIVLKDTTGMATGMLISSSLLPMIISYPASAFFFKRFGKRNTVLGALVLIFIGSVVSLVNAYNLPLACLGQVIKGFGGAPCTASMYAMLSDTVEYGEWKTGIRTEGLTFSAASFGMKIGTGIGGILTGLFVGTTTATGAMEMGAAASELSIILVYFGTPVVISIINSILYFMYKLDKEYPKVIRELAERKQAVQQN